MASVTYANLLDAARDRDNLVFLNGQAPPILQVLNRWLCEQFPIAHGNRKD